MVVVRNFLILYDFIEKGRILEFRGFRGEREFWEFGIRMEL